MVPTRDAWINVEANKLAKTKVDPLQRVPPYYKLLGNPWGCYTGTKQIVTQFDAALQTWINGKETQDSTGKHASSLLKHRLRM